MLLCRHRKKQRILSMYGRIYIITYIFCTSKSIKKPFRRTFFVPRFSSFENMTYIFCTRHTYIFWPGKMFLRQKRLFIFKQLLNSIFIVINYFLLNCCFILRNLFFFNIHSVFFPSFRYSIIICRTNLNWFI